ncbi:hypothetical protein B9T31_07325 [Acinetobacter sp. ANC 4558]|uniref:DUF2846 domain-containing protein n=1 Tax=Acinetobacter sp. ANC 4558 TaxID=1977876 RepID=UPI000A34DBBC|nr:DUF2846 domain-containing protein [Acinetobacter sp. ANC 4558]OTG86793.1 hypothetical protein B9T31_07325 [Acinetobacter sp. ANC 4558]
MKIKLILSLLCTLAFVGCASVPKADQTESQKLKNTQVLAQGKSGIYVYRNNSYQGAALKKDIWINGECLGESSKGIFFYKEVDGDQDYIISTESEFSPNHLTLAVQSGQNYYIQQKIKMGVVVGGAKLEKVDEVQAQKIISQLDLGVQGHCSKQHIELPKK